MINRIDELSFRTHAEVQQNFPIKTGETALRQPQEILAEMKALDEESAEILNSILELI